MSKYSFRDMSAVDANLDGRQALTTDPPHSCWPLHEVSIKRPLNIGPK